MVLCRLRCCQIVSCARYRSTWTHEKESKRELAIQEVDRVAHLHGVPTAREGSLFRSRHASTMDLAVQHPSINQVYDFSFMLYLAQTCHMIAKGGWFRDNLRGSGQILPRDPTTMWHTAGCSRLFPGFNATFPVAACDSKNAKVIGTGALAQMVVATVEDCIQKCADAGDCKAYSYATTGCSQEPGCGDQDHMCYLRSNNDGEKDQPGRVSGTCIRDPTSSLDDYKIDWLGGHYIECG